MSSPRPGDRQQRRAVLGDEGVRRLLEEATTVAVVGASTDEDKAANRIPRALLDAGFRVIPVNPEADEVHGQQAYASLAEVPGPVDIVDVFRPGDEAADIARQAVAIGAGALWLQLDITSDDARRIAGEHGLSYVEDRCIGQTTKSMGIRKVTP
jgi:uncharacterized protein